MAGLGRATIELVLETKAFDAALKGLAPALNAALSSAESAGKNAGSAFTNSASEAISRLKVTTILQPELDRTAKIFRTAGETSGKSFVAGFAANLKGLVPALSISDSAANGAAAGQAFVTALKGGGNSTEAGSTKGRQFSQAYVASVLAGLANLTNVGTSSAGAFGAAYQAKLAQVFGGSNSIASSQQQTVSQSATTGTAGGAAFALNYAASVSQGAERILATIVATNAKVRERSATEGTAGGAVFALNYAAAIGAGRDRILAAMLSAVSSGGGAQSGAGNGTAAGNAFAGNYAIAVSGVGARVFASLAANAGQASTSGNAYGQAFTTGFERGSSNVYGVLNNISNRANTVGSSISQSISSGFASIGSAASGAAGAVAANKYVVAFTGALSAITGAVNSVIKSGLNTVGAAAGAGAAAGGAFHAAFTNAASKLPGASIGQNLGNGLVGGIKSSFNAGYKLGDWLKKGTVNIGKQIGQQIASQVQFGISNAVIGLGASLFDTKNFGEADKQARRVETIAKGQRKEYQKDAQGISKRLGYTVTSAEVSDAQYESLSSGYSKKSEVNPLVENALKIKAISGGEASSKDVIKGVGRLGLVLRDTGFSGKGDKPLDLSNSETFNKIASIISSTVDASSSVEPGLAGRQLPGILEQSARRRLNTFQTAGVFSAATQKVEPGRVISGLPGFFSGVDQAAGSKKISEAATKLGFNQSSQTQGFNTASLINKDFIPFLEDLKNKLDKTTAEKGPGESASLLTQLIPSKQARNAIAPILTTQGLEAAKTASSDIEKGSNSGSIDTKFATVTEGLISKQQAFKNSLIELDVQIKESIVGTLLTEAFGAAANAVKGLGDGIVQLTNWYNGLDAGTKGVVDTIGKVVLAITGVVGSIGLFGAAWNLIAIPLGAAAFALAKILIPVAPIGIALAGLGVIVFKVSKALGATDGDAFRNAMIAVAAGMALIFGPPALIALGTGVAAFVTGFISIGTAAGASLVFLAPYILAGAAIALALFLAYKAFEAFKPIAEEWGRILREKIIEAWQAAGRTLNEWGQNIKNGWNSLGQAFQAAGNYIAAVWNFLGDLFKAFGRGIVTVTTFIFNGYWNMVRGIASAIGNWIKSQSAVRGAMRFLSDGVEAFKRHWVDGYNTAGRAIEWFRNVVVNAFTYVKNSLGELIDKAASLPGLFGAAAKALNSLNGIKGNFPSPPVPVPLAPQQTSSLPNSTGNLSDNTLIGGTGDDRLGAGGTFAIGAALVGQFKKGLQSGLVAGNTGGGVLVNASEFSPGGGGDEGPKKDIRSQRLLPSDFAVATPLAGKPGGLPYGTTVRVTNPNTGKSTEAIARDGGPYVPGRQLDLTTAVARAIGFKGLGVLKLEIVKLPNGVSGGQFYTGEASKLRSVSSVAPGSGLQVPFVGQSASAYSTPTLSKGLSPFPGVSVDELRTRTQRNQTDQEKFRATRKRNGISVPGAHEGEDFAVPVGTAVQSSYTGTATAKRYGSTYGNHAAVVVTFVDEHGRKIINELGHLQPGSITAALGLTPGDGKSVQVRAGQEIGKVAGFSNSFQLRNPTVNPHLHDAIYVGTQEGRNAVRPLDFLQSTRVAGGGGYQSTESRSPGYSAPFRGSGGYGGIGNYGSLGSGSISKDRERPYKDYDLGRFGREREAREQKEREAASKPVEKPPVIVPPSKLVETKPIVVVPSAPVVPSKPAAVTATIPVVTEPTDPTAGTTAPSLVDDIPVPDLTIKLKKSITAREDLTAGSSIGGNIKYEITEPATTPVVRKPVTKKPPIPRPSTIPAVAKIKPVRKISDDNNYQGTGFSKAQLLGADYVAANSGKTAGTVSTTPINTSATDDQVIGDSKNSAALAEKIREAEVNLAAALENKRLTEASNKKGTTGNATALKNAQDALARAQKDERTAKKPSSREAAKKRQELAQQKIDQLRANPGADNKSDLAVNERVRKAQERLDKLKATAVEAQKKDDEAQKKADFDNIKQKVDDVKDQTATLQSKIERDLAAKPTPENQKKAELDKADLLRSATTELDKLLPALEQLRKKYTDAESGKEANGILREINSAAAASDNASTVINKLPLTEQATKADTLISDAAAADLKADSAVLGDPSLTSAAIDEKAARYATLKEQLTAVAEEAKKIATALGDPESLKTLAAIENKLREVGDTALKTAQAANANKVTILAEGANEITAQAEKRTLGVNIAALEGTITAIEKEEALLFIRQLASQQLQELIPLLEAAKAATTDPNAIKLADEQLGKLRLYKAEVINTATEFKRTKEEASLLYRTSKDLTESLDTGLRSILKDSLNGFRNLGSILDGILNKIADAAISAGIEALLGGTGGAKGTNKSGDFFGTLISGAAKIFGFKTGGYVQNYAEGGGVSSLGGYKSAASLGMAVQAAMAIEGSKAVPIVVSEGELILTAQQAKQYEEAAKIGTGRGLISNFATGGYAGSAAFSSPAPSINTGGGSGETRGITIDRINQVDYITVEQFQQIMQVQLPLAAKAGAEITNRNLQNTAYRSQYGIS